VKRDHLDGAQVPRFTVGRFLDNDSCMGAVGLMLRQHGRLA
jgi:hypothetical protein